MNLHPWDMQHLLPEELDAIARYFDEEQREMKRAQRG